MRILIVTQWFDPEPAFKGIAFAKALQDRGHNVSVLTGFPNYPGGKLYPGYKVRTLQREFMNGIEVTRLPLFPSHDRSSVRRGLNYASFSASLSVLGNTMARNADVMYVYHPPLTVGIAASIINKVRGIPFLYDVQDLWPDTLHATGMVNSQAILNIAGRACDIVYRRASAITVLSPGFKRRLAERGVPESKIHMVYNWAHDGDFVTSEPRQGMAQELGFAGKFNVVFAGNMGKAQALDAPIDAAALLLTRCPQVLFTFVGGGIEVERLKKKAATLGLSNVHFLPRVPLSEIGSILTLADVLLVHLKKDPLFRITIPSKTQAYLAAGKPIIMAVEGDAADLVSKAQAGFVCPPEEPKALAAIVERMQSTPAGELKMMGERGRQFYDSELSMARGVKRFESILQGIAKN